MIGEQPGFMDSPFFVNEPGNWHLKPGAPADVVEEFRVFQQDGRRMERPLQLPPVVKLTAEDLR